LTRGTMRPLWFMVAAGLVACVTAIATPPLVIQGQFLKVQMALAVLLFSLQLLTAWLFLSGMRTFSGRLRLAYAIFAAGMVLFGVAELQFPVLGLLHALNSRWISSGAVLLPFITSGLATYISVRLFARLLAIRFFATSFVYVFLLSLLVSGLVVLLPHRRITASPDARLQYETFMALLSWLFAINLVTASLLWRVRMSIGPLYTRAVRWLAIGMSMGAAAELAELLYSLLTPYSLTWYTKYSFNYLPIIAAVVVLLVAADAFQAIARRRLASDASYIDAIVYMEQLVSNPSALNDVRDRLLTLTSRMSDRHSTRLSAAEISALRRLYIEVEEYLVNKEPLRHFDRQELRSLLPERIAQSFSAVDSEI